MKKTRNILVLLLALCGILASCYSNNCPLENTVLCNYYFYDAEGTPIKYGDEITVSTLMPGWKDVYVYKRLGSLTITKDYLDSALIKQDYSVTISRNRNDSIILNKQSSVSSISLPMSYFNAADTLVFAYSSISLKDTVIVEQDSYPHVELPECGTYRYHTLKTIRATDAALDHIEIAYPIVNYEGKENVKLFFNGVVLH